MEVQQEIQQDVPVLVRKRNRNSYLREFLMLFLAVFCGFLAEYQLEKVFERQQEKEYVTSLIVDAQTDIANLDRAIAKNETRIVHLDTLADICLNYDRARTKDYEFYKHYIYGVYHPEFVTLTERTISQLKNAGGMRLIRSKAVADSIVLYDEMSNKLFNQQAYYELYQNNSINLGVKIINFQKFGFGASGQRLQDFEKRDEYFTLLSHDKKLLAEFGNMVLIYEGVVAYYNDLLMESKMHARHLIVALQTEYHLE